MAKFLIFIIFLGLASASLAAAHFVNGFTAESQSGEYVSEVGVNLQKPVASVGLTLDFHLKNQSLGLPVDFTSVDVSIDKNGQNYLKQTVNNQFNIASVVVVFPEAGDYNLHLIYKNQNELIAESDLTLPIAKYPSNNVKKIMKILVWVMAIALGFLLTNLLYLKFKRN